MDIQKRQAFGIAALAFVLAACNSPARIGQSPVKAVSDEDNPVFFFPDASLERDEVYFVAEIPEGSDKKFEMRTATGKLFLDRVICPKEVYGSSRSVAAFPANYGFSPGRFSPDGDPLDLVVLGSRSKYEEFLEKGSTKARKVRILGMMKMEECSEVPCQEERWERDWKVVGLDVEDPVLGGAKEIEDIPSERLAELTEYWSNYKGPQFNKSLKKYFPQTRVAGYLPKEEALEFMRTNFPLFSKEDRKKEIQDCREVFERALKNSSSAVPPDPFYAKCLSRVDYEHFKPASPRFRFFLKHNALQLLLDRGETGLSPDNVFERMDQLRARGKTYYRFVSHDAPSPPGTGQPIFEWVKTKDRSDGCSPEFPAQHYLSRPLVDL